jgi:gliding motility-associated-like protein
MNFKIARHASKAIWSRCLPFVLLPVLSIATLRAQDCPPNIGFESGNFDNWTCYLGFVVEQNNQNSIRLSPTAIPGFNRHTLYSNSNATELDFYGKFPVRCPNGSGYSVKLGNVEGGALAEGLSYEFTIPGNRNSYTLSYHYAVVFQEPDHKEHQQPRFEVELLNVTRKELLSCGSFVFRPYRPLTPGFSLAFDTANSVPVWYKDWTPVSISLDNRAGETIRLSFKTADCTYFDHFAYAYIDVDNSCNGEFIGANYCPDDTVVNLSAPPGYQNYIWHSRDFSQVISKEQTVKVTPQQAASGGIPVEVYPFYGYGCIDTLYAKQGAKATIQSNAGVDMLSCNNDSVMLGRPPEQGLSYQWSPAVGLSNPNDADPLANPAVTTTYILRTGSDGGGCASNDTVVVSKAFINDSMRVAGELFHCVGNGDFPVLSTGPADNIQWYLNDKIIDGAILPSIKANEPGSYFALVSGDNGCRHFTSVKTVAIDFPKPGIRYATVNGVINLPAKLEARNFGDSYHWMPAFQLDNELSKTPVFTGSRDQVYTVAITTLGGCVTIDTQMVKIFPHAEIYVPYAFTPNDDGRNDVFRPILVGIKELRSFSVFNRWGQLLFSTKAPGDGWNGKFGGHPVGPQIVVWMAEATGWDDKTYLRKGTALIYR